MRKPVFYFPLLKRKEEMDFRNGLEVNCATNKLKFHVHNSQGIRNFSLIMELLDSKSSGVFLAQRHTP